MPQMAQGLGANGVYVSTPEDFRAALAQDLTHDPVAFVFIARGQAVAAGAVLLAVLECALIDAAVVILLGDDVLRRHAQR